MGKIETRDEPSNLSIATENPYGTLGGITFKKYPSLQVDFTHYSWLDVLLFIPRLLIFKKATVRGKE